MVDAPHDLDFERALLAAIMRDNAVLDQLGSFSGDQFLRSSTPCSTCVAAVEPSMRLHCAN
jgi:hypothetical protein